jgi:hypothetical protein
MDTLPKDIIAVLQQFAPLFSRSVFEHVKVLICGAILTNGNRTVAAALRAMGLTFCKRFDSYHRVLNRDKWSGRLAAHTLLKLLVAAFAPTGAILIGVDETIERRGGRKIKALGVYRDAVRSTKEHLVKTTGLRWISMMLIVYVPFANRKWALPFMTVLAPSEHYDQDRGRKHKTLSDWTIEMILQVRRWLPDREITVVGDSSYADLELLDAAAKMSKPVVIVTRLRLDAVLHDLPEPRKPGTIGRPQKKGKVRPKLKDIAIDKNTVWKTVTVYDWYDHAQKELEIVSDTCIWYNHGSIVHIRYVLVRDPKGIFEPLAFLSTDVSMEPETIISAFVLRWRVEVTFEELREHLGMETQREWHDLAIHRTTPALMGLFSMVTLMAHHYLSANPMSARQSSWYQKERLTFSDAIACVRRHLWRQIGFEMSPVQSDITKPFALAFERATEILCYSR